MDFMTKLERKFGKFSIPNLTVILIAGFILGYMIEIFSPAALELIALDPAKVMQGQIYRLITWVVIPPGAPSIFIISGIVFTDIGIMITYFVMKLMGQAGLLNLYYEYGLYGASTYYLCMSMFLAYAFMFPDRQVLLYFIIPIRIKWLGYLDIAYLILTILQYGLMGYFTGMVTVVMSVLNFILFYFVMKGKGRVSPSHRKRKKSYRQQVRQTQILTRHKCAICGQTEEDNPDLEFRYCSRCKGNYEYCQNHLFTHPHKKF